MPAAAHDIRLSIPLTDQTNPAKFPEYEFREYPKGMNMLANKEYLDDWLARNKTVDDQTGKASWPGGRPIVGKSIVPILDDNLQPVFVADEDEEAAFRAEHADVHDHVDPEAERSRLNTENEDLRAQIAKLRAGAVGVETGSEPEAEKDDGSEPQPAALKATAPVKPAAPVKKTAALPPRLK